MASNAVPSMSEAEFLALPESNQRIELIDGEVVVSPSPSYRHQKVLQRLVIALQSWADHSGSRVTIAQSPLDVRFAPGRILQPDAMVFTEILPDDVAMPIARIPALCIEVLSENRVHDRVTKRYLYAEAGVREYWLLDLAGRAERRTGSGLSHVEMLTERLTSPLLPGFSLDLAQLFARS
jgi:Uma2 family endonuclease